MNIPKRVIEKAIAGGWRPPFNTHLNHTFFLRAINIHWASIALDPAFWQALGKSCGWREEEWHPTRTYPDGSQKTWPGYMKYVHRFYDLILTGGNVEAFWEEISPSKE